MVVQFPPPWKAEFPTFTRWASSLKKEGNFICCLRYPNRSAVPREKSCSGHPPKMERALNVFRRNPGKYMGSVGKNSELEGVDFCPGFPSTRLLWYMALRPRGLPLPLPLRCSRFCFAPCSSPEARLPSICLEKAVAEKEGLAALIHRSSEQRDGPFVPVNCGALHSTLGHGELFGRERWVRTSAASPRPRRIGTRSAGASPWRNVVPGVFHEVGELSRTIRSGQIPMRLLRVLETGRFRRIGSNREQEINFTIFYCDAPPTRIWNRQSLQEAFVPTLY